MAEIYRARYQAAAGVTKPVVIKKILPAYAGNPKFVSMFINEAKIVVGLAHGNIAQVFDFGEIDGEYYLAMELVPGYPLSKVMKQARAMGIPVLPAPFACFIGLELSKGLHYAHTRRDEKNRLLELIHRDVSPQNILLSYEGQVKIVDFGIAKARNATAPETQVGAVKGKYVYFAPEQCRGEELDARTDVWATGVVLYEMLTGRLPFEGRMIEVFRRIIAGDFDRPRSVNANIPASLEGIVLKALAPQPARRYQSAQALGDDLANFLFAQAPTFSNAALAQLMGLLYEDELRAEGFPVHLRPEFRREVEGWRSGKYSLPGDKTQSHEGLPQPVRMRLTPARGTAIPTGDEDEATLPPEEFRPAPTGRAARGTGSGRTRSTELAPRVGASAGHERSTELAPRVGASAGHERSTELAPRLERSTELAPRLAPPGGADARAAALAAAREEGLITEPFDPSEHLAPASRPGPPVPDASGEPATPWTLDASPGVASPRPDADADADAARSPFASAADEVAQRLLGPEEPEVAPSGAATRPLVPRVMPIAPPAARRPPRWLFAALPILALVVATGAVLALGSRSASIQLTSEPPGAVVRVDGTPAPTRTPLLISELDPEVPHLLEVQFPGMQPWQQRLTLRQGKLTEVHARLLPIPPPPPLPDTAP